MIISEIIFGIIGLLLGVAYNEVFFIIIGAGSILHAIYRFIKRPKKDRAILKHGYNGTAEFIRRFELLSKNRHRYSVYYGYTDENGEYHEVVAPGLFTDNQSSNIKACGNFPIKYIGKESVLLVDLTALSD